MTDLADLVEPLKREVAVPGTFSALFPETTDQDLTDALLDAFAQTQLDGFLADSTASDEALVTPDLSRGAQALIVLYAGIRFLTVDLINRKTHTRYEANGAVFEQDAAASVLTQALKDLRLKKESLLEAAKASARARVGTTVVDGYFIKATDFYSGEVAGYGYSDPYGRL